MKKLLLIFALLAALFLSGCTTAEEVQRRTVVHAIGIDRSESVYEVSYQVFSGGQSDSGGPVDAEEETVKTLLTQGRTLYEAEENLRLQTGKDVFLGDVELVVISEELKDEDLTEFLQYFKKSDVYLGVNVIYCRGRAADTVGAKLNQGSATAILLREVVEEAIEKGRAQSSRIIEIYNAIKEDGEAAAIPIISLEKGGDGEEDSNISDTVIKVSASQIISSDGAGEEIDENTIMGVRLLRGDVKEMSMLVKTPQGVASIELTNIKIKREINIVDSLPEVRVKISGIYDIRSYPDGVGEEEIRLAAQSQIVELCSDAVTAASGVDIFQIKKMLMKYESKYARDLGDEIDGIIPKTAFSVTVKLKKY